MFVTKDLVYYTLNEVRSLLSDLEGAGRRDADVLLRMIETYEPSTHAVVNVAIKGHNLISIKMKLERPNVEVKGVRSVCQHISRQAVRARLVFCFRRWLPS